MNFGFFSYNICVYKRLQRANFMLYHKFFCLINLHIRYIINHAKVRLFTNYQRNSLKSNKYCKLKTDLIMLFTILSIGVLIYNILHRLKWAYYRRTWNMYGITSGRWRTKGRKIPSLYQFSYWSASTLIDRSSYSYIAWERK